jgi:putative cell wall-binding protein/Ca2+-binding RTX toxin-like protein
VSGDSLRGMEEASTWTLDGDKITYTNNVIKSILENANIEDTKDSIRISVVGIEILVGSDAGDTFLISGTVPYSLVGGAGDDIFRLLNNARLQGSLDGGAGQDTLDFSLYETARNIILTAVGEDGFSGKEAALTGGFANIDNLIGSLADNDRLTGLNDSGIFRLGTEQDENVAQYENGGKILTFSGIENLYGGNGDDLFEIRGQHSYNLYGGAGDDTFKFIGAAELEGTIDGGSGVNTLDYSASGYKDSADNNIGVTVDLSEGSATGVSNGAEDKVQNISNLIGSAYNDILIGNDRDNVIIGGAGNDYLEGRGGYNTYIFEEDWGEDTVINSSGRGMLDLSALGADWHLVINLTYKIITVNSSLPGNKISFDSISDILTGSGNDEFIISDRQKMNLEGGDGDDTFKFVGDGILEGIIDGGTGYNTLDYSDYATAVMFNLAAMNATSLNGFTNIHKLIGSNSNGVYDTIRGTNSDSRYEITAENAGKITWKITLGGQVVEYNFDFEGIENLIGGSGNDTFAIIDQGRLTGSIDGGAGSNTLDYSKYDNGDNTGVKVDLSKDQRSATAIGNGEPGMISNIQNVVGSPYNDELIGHETESNTFIFEDNWGNDTVNPGGGLNILDLSRMSIDIIITLDCKELQQENEILYSYEIIVKHLDVYNPNGEDALYTLTITWDNRNNAFKEIHGSQGQNKYHLNADYTTDLYGGDSDDIFYLADSVTLSGKIDGRGGSNTLDFSAYRTGRDISIIGAGTESGFNGTERSITKGFYNISALVGSKAEDAVDRLRGANADATFELDATFEGDDIWNKYFLNQDSLRKLLFTDFEILHGGSKDDTFIIEGEQRYDLYGEAGNDTFVFADGAKLVSNSNGQLGNIDGGSGTNTLDYSAYTTTRNFYLTDLGSITGFNGREQSIAGEFRNITNIIGGEATDSLSGLNEANTWEVSGENSGTYRTNNRVLTFSNIDTLNGGALNDHFVIKEGGSLSGHIDGRSGTDTLDYSAYLTDIKVDLTADLASDILKGISSIENVTGGRGNDTIIGDDKDNVLSGGPGDDTIYGGGGDDTIYGDAGDDELYGEEGNDTIDGGAGDDYLHGGDGDDTLITGTGHNTLVGGEGNDEAIVAYRSSYDTPDNDIENWVFLQPPVGPPGGGVAPAPTETEEEIDSSVGGTVSLGNVTVVIPPNVLPGNATIRIEELKVEDLGEILTDNLKISILGKVYEITTSGERYFGETNYITISFDFDPKDLPLGQRPVIHYYDEEQGKWVEIKTEIEYDEETGKWKAVVKVNHLTKFALFAAPWRPYSDDRYLTAVAISQTGWRSSDYAVLVRGDNFADALSAGPLANKYGGPLLLTRPKEISKDTLNELRRLGVKKVFIVGGKQAISEDVEETVKALGITVERISGSDRYETAVKVAEKVGRGLENSVFIANGNNFPDALSASAIAAKLGVPILLTKREGLPESVQSYLKTNKVSEALLVGGRRVIDNTVEESLSGLTAKLGIKVTRLAGEDRYETNLAVLKYFAANIRWEKLYVATGQNFADGLTGAVLAARTSAPLILTGKVLPPATALYLQAVLEPDTEVTVLGGEKAVPEALLNTIKSLCPR